MLIRSAAAALAIAIAAPAAMAQDAAPAAQAEALPDIALGADDAPLTIVEYASFTCGHCANFHEENWPRQKAE